MSRHCVYQDAEIPSGSEQEQSSTTFDSKIPQPQQQSPLTKPLKLA